MSKTNVYIATKTVNEAEGTWEEKKINIYHAESDGHTLTFEVDLYLMAFGHELRFVSITGTCDLSSFSVDLQKVLKIYIIKTKAYIQHHPMLAILFQEYRLFIARELSTHIAEEKYTLSEEEA
jgi:hypothetical protein